MHRQKHVIAQLAFMNLFNKTMGYDFKLILKIAYIAKPVISKIPNKTSSGPHPKDPVAQIT
jgi:hypothetical protein